MILAFESFPRFLLACIHFVLLFSAGSHAFAENGFSNSTPSEKVALLRDAVDKVLHQLDAKQGPGMAVWVEVNDEVIYSNWGGLAQRDKKIPIDGDTVFELASASKPLTAAIVLQLCERGGLNLDDFAITWIPDLPKQWSRITVHNLLSQTSGIPDFLSQINAAKLVGLDGLTNQQLLQRWRANPALNFPSGSEVEYSNSNYVLLAEIISQVCGTSFAQCMRERIFIPLGMKHSRVESEQALESETLALNYAASVRTKGIQLRTEGPTGIYSSLNDVALWLRAYKAGDIVSKTAIKLMTTPSSSKSIFENGERYGMGWVLPAENSPAGAFEHAGQKDGYRTLIRGNPTHKVNYIILSNGGDFVQFASTEVQYWIKELFEQPD